MTPMSGLANVGWGRPYLNTANDALLRQVLQADQQRAVQDPLEKRIRTLEQAIRNAEKMVKAGFVIPEAWWARVCAGWPNPPTSFEVDQVVQAAMPTIASAFEPRRRRRWPARASAGLTVIALVGVVIASLA